MLHPHQGTVIRVFSIPDGVKQFEFRRGVKRCRFVSHSVYIAQDVLVTCDCCGDKQLTFLLSVCVL